MNLGLVPGMGGTQRLPRLVGLSKGIDLIATGTSLSPEQALGLGVVDRLCDDAAACRTAAVDYCATLAAGPAEAVGRAKTAINYGYAPRSTSAWPWSERRSRATSPPTTPPKASKPSPRSESPPSNGIDRPRKPPTAPRPTSVPMMDNTGRGPWSMRKRWPPSGTRRAWVQLVVEVVDQVDTVEADVDLVDGEHRGARRGGGPRQVAVTPHWDQRVPPGQVSAGDGLDLVVAFRSLTPGSRPIFEGVLDVPHGAVVGPREAATDVGIVVAAPVHPIRPYRDGEREQCAVVIAEADVVPRLDVVDVALAQPRIEHYPCVSEHRDGLLRQCHLDPPF